MWTGDFWSESVFVLFGIGPTIWTHQEIQCLLYAGFFLLQIFELTALESYYMLSVYAPYHLILKFDLKTAAKISESHCITRKDNTQSYLRYILFVWAKLSYDDKYSNKFSFQEHCRSSFCGLPVWGHPRFSWWILIILKKLKTMFPSFNNQV